MLGMEIIINIPTHTEMNKTLPNHMMHMHDCTGSLKTSCHVFISTILNKNI